MDETMEKIRVQQCRDLLSIEKIQNNVEIHDDENICGYLFHGPRGLWLNEIILISFRSDGGLKIEYRQKLSYLYRSYLNEINQECHLRQMDVDSSNMDCNNQRILVDHLYATDGLDVTINWHTKYISFVKEDTYKCIIIFDLNNLMLNLFLLLPNYAEFSIISSRPLISLAFEYRLSELNVKYRYLEKFKRYQIDDSNNALLLNYENKRIKLKWTDDCAVSLHNNESKIRRFGGLFKLRKYIMMPKQFMLFHDNIEYNELELKCIRHFWSKLQANFRYDIIGNSFLHNCHDNELSSSSTSTTTTTTITRNTFISTLLSSSPPLSSSSSSSLLLPSLSSSIMKRHNREIVYFINANGDLSSKRFIHLSD